MISLKFIPTLLNQSQPGLITQLGQYLDQLEIKNSRLAQWICRLIPGTCPFERDLTLLGHTYHIPPLCKLNPLYEQLIGLRWRALCYLAEV